MASKPPLELAVELTDANGNVSRWDGKARSAGNIPTGITFNTKRGDGFSDGPQITLQRRIDRDYSDINLYDDVRLIGADGSVAYEGYIAANPRSYNGGHTVSIRVAGPMTLAQRRPFSEVFIDRDLSKWQGLTNRRDIDLITTGYSPTDGALQADPSGNAAITTEFTDSTAWSATSRPYVGAIYVPPSGVMLGSMYYEWEKGSNIDAADANWKWQALLGDDDATFPDQSGNLRGAGPGSGTLTATAATRAYGALELLYQTAGGTGDGSLKSIYWRNLAAIGTHGLALQPSSTPGPGGLYVSDMIANICSRFAPRLDPSGVKQTDYPVDHAVFEQVQPYDAWKTLNTFHLWELGVWENRVLTYEPADLSDFDWFVRLSDPGVTIDLPGESTEQLANGIVVTYLDVQTGLTLVLSPDTTPELQDSNPLNPATLHGETAWSTVDLTSIPLTAADATQLGIAALAEANQAKAAGTIKFIGHIRDRQGNWQPGWKVRASDTIAIVDHPDDRPRLIGETTWNQDTLTGTIAVDNTLNRMDAYLSRVASAVQAAGPTRSAGASLPGLGSITR